MGLINVKNLLNQNNRHKRKKSANVKGLLKDRSKVLNGFESKLSPIGKQTQVKVIKILTPKQMLQRLLIALAKVKAGNTSEN